MTYRRYPDRDRALSQVERNRPAAPVRELSEFEQRLAVQARAALEHAERELAPLGEALRQLTVAAPAVLAQTAPVAYKFIEALKQPSRA